MTQTVETTGTISGRWTQRHDLDTRFKSAQTGEFTCQNEETRETCGVVHHTAKASRIHIASHWGSPWWAHTRTVSRERPDCDWYPVVR